MRSMSSSHYTSSGQTDSGSGPHFRKTCGTTSELVTEDFEKMQ
jgi:hypothetical protein